MHEDLLALRGQFPILERSVYMNSNSLGAMPRGVFNAMESFASTWATRGVRAWHEGWWEMPVTTGNLLCDILHAPHGSISMHQNVTIAEAVLLSSFEFTGRRNKIVYEALNFPSVMYIMEEQKRRGARIVEVPGTDDGIGVPIERLLAAIDEETLLVPVSHVLFRSAFIQDARRIVERAHAVGARVILDIYQGAGTVPVDLVALNVDFAVGGSVKWLCGGPGAGYLYVRPDLARDLQPAFTGWQAHARPFAFEAGAMSWGDPEYRFLNGTPHIPALYAAQEGYKIIRSIGTQKIRERSLHLTDLLLAEAAEARIPVCCPQRKEERGGTVALAPRQAERLCQELLKREIVVDYRPKSGVRVSPHFYNTEDECRTVVRQAAEILKALPDA